MQETSALYRRILADDNHWFEVSVVIGESGDLVTELGDKILFGGTAIVVARTNPESGYTETQIFSIRTDTQMLGSTLEVGKAVSQEIELQMIKPAGDIPQMAQVVPYVRAISKNITTTTDAVVSRDILQILNYASVQNDILVFEPDHGVAVNKDILTFTEDQEGEYLYSEWIKQGVYYIDTREYSNNDDNLTLLTLHGYDAMLKTEQDYADTSLDWPATDIDVVREIASKIGVSVDPRTVELMAEGYQIPLPTSYTLRETLGYIGAKYLGSFIISDVGDLRLVSLLEIPPDSSLLIDQIGDYITFGGDRIKLSIY